MSCNREKVSHRLRANVTHRRVSAFYGKATSQRVFTGVIPPRWHSGGRDWCRVQVNTGSYQSATKPLSVPVKSYRKERITVFALVM